MNIDPFNSEFRKQFPQFQEAYNKLDALGGSSCKSCNRGKQQKLLNEIKEKMEPEKHKQFLEQKVSQSVFIQKPKFNNVLLAKQTRDFLRNYSPKLIAEYDEEAKRTGYYSNEIKLLVDKIYLFYTENQELRVKLSEFINNNNLVGKILPAQSRIFCKIISDANQQNLENRVNDFIFDKDVKSVTVQGTAATIVYQVKE
jgi:Fe-S cluster biosynthesis and repair protein YggX